MCEIICSLDSGNGVYLYVWEMTWSKSVANRWSRYLIHNYEYDDIYSRARTVLSQRVRE